MIKGVVFDFKRFAIHDGPGIRTTIFFKGCPLSCWWCHNPESQRGEPQASVRHLTLDGKTHEQEEITGRYLTVSEVVQEVTKDRIFYEESGGGVTLSGGEPLFQPDFCEPLLQSLKEHRIHTAIDTSGYASEDELYRIIPYTDLFLYDLKLMNDVAHTNYTGVSNRTILENLKRLFRAGKSVVIRLPVIPRITDTSDNIQAIIDFLKPYRLQTDPSPSRFPDRTNITLPLEVHLLPYHMIGRNKYHKFHMEDKMLTKTDGHSARLPEIRERFEQAGFTVKI